MIDIEQLKAEIGKKLKAAREAKGMSQEELAGRLGLTKVGYGALERGKNLIGLQHLIALTFILEKPATYFLPRYAVTETELNDLAHDPAFQQLQAAWLYLRDANRKELLEMLRSLAAFFREGVEKEARDD